MGFFFIWVQLLILKLSIMQEFVCIVAKQNMNSELLLVTFKFKLIVPQNLILSLYFSIGDSLKLLCMRLEYYFKMFESSVEVFF